MPLLIAVMLLGCAAAPRTSDALPTRAFDAGLDSPLGRLASRATDGLAPGDSALHVLASGQDALGARLALVGEAERGIDIQSYIFRADKSGVGLMSALREAADRGVRVRLLLDDWGSRSNEPELLRLAAHAQIEVRLFNPLVHPQSGLLSLLLDFQRTQQRMHNKLFVADGQAAIVGGRNIGDEYFSRRRELEFGDVDVLAIGPVVPQLSESFDRYWNHPLAAPLVMPTAGTFDPAPGPERAAVPWRSLAGSRWETLLSAGQLRRFAGRATAVQDMPDKLDPGRADPLTPLGADIARLMGRVEQELLIVSPYFVPGAGGVAQLRELARRGVRVTVVTNTLAATDVPAVHAGYARYRSELTAAGIALYEVRADAPNQTRGRAGRAGSSRLSLHAKLLVVDRRSTFIGSMNIDPRSLRLNTENGVVIDSPELAAELAAGVQRALVDDAWRVHVDAGQLRWIGVEHGAAVTLDREPGAGWWLRVQALVLSWLPIEGLL